MFFLIGLISFILSIAILVTYFHMNDRLKEISWNTSKALEKMAYQSQQAENTQKQLLQLRINQLNAQRQYFFDHCFMDNLKPHEWYPTGNQSPTEYEFICRKCGQRIMTPKYLQIEPAPQVPAVFRQNAGD